MNNVDLGCGQITWNRSLSEDEVLADIATAGYVGAPLSARGRTADEVRDAYAKHGLRPAPGYFGANFWDVDKHDEFIAQAREQARIHAALGVTEIYVAVGGFDLTAPSGRTRAAAAGHAEDADALSDKDFQQLATTLDAIGRATLEEGVRSCFHNHVGTFVETEAEIERLLSMVDPEVLFLGPDTGHLAWGGVDVVEFTRRHADRIKTAHLKDVTASVVDESRAQGWDYGTSNKHGVWTEIGEGCVDFATTLRLLEDAGFSGWLIVETDVTQKPTALESATICRDTLRKLGV